MTKCNSGAILLATIVLRGIKVAEAKSQTNNDAQLQEFLLANLQSVIKHFLPSWTPSESEKGQESWTKILDDYEALCWALKSIEQAYRARSYIDNTDIKPVNGDNPENREDKNNYYNNLRKKQELEPQVRVILLEQLFLQQLSVDEVQDALAWAENPAYASVNVYDNDKEDPTEDLKVLLANRQRVLEELCQKALANPEIRAYVAMCVAEQIKKRAQTRPGQTITR